MNGLDSPATPHRPEHSGRDALVSFLDVGHRPAIDLDAQPARGPNLLRCHSNRRGRSDLMAVHADTTAVGSGTSGGEPATLGARRSVVGRPGRCLA
jgi:hypothetical protein